MKESRWQGPLAVYVRRLAASEIAEPWPDEIDAAVRAPDAVPLCLNCLFPQDGYWWFCPHCGFPGGEYVTWMPYLQVFATNEVIFRGVCGPPDRRWGVVAGLVVFSAMQYTFFAPLYWYWMFRKARGRPISSGRRVDLVFEDTP